MAKQDQANISVPAVLQSEAKLLAMRYGGIKKKWAVYSAGLLRLLEMEEPARDEFVGKVIGARSVPGGLAKLIDGLRPPRVASTKGEEAPRPPALPVGGRGPRLPAGETRSLRG